MSGVVKGVGKVFKKVGKVLQPLLKPALIGAGIIFGGLALGSAAVASGLAAPGAIPTLGSVLGGGAASSGVASGAISAIGSGTLGGGGTAAGTSLIPALKAAAATTAAGSTPTLAGSLAGGTGALGAASGQAAAMLGQAALPAATQTTPSVLSQIGATQLGGAPGLGAALPSPSILGRIEDWMKAHPNLVKYGGGALGAAAKGIGTAKLAEQLQDEYYRNRRDELRFRYPKLTAEGSSVPGMDMSSVYRPSASGGRTMNPITTAPAMSLPEAGLTDAPSIPLGQAYSPIPGLERRLAGAQGGGSALSPFARGVPITGYGLPYRV